MPDSKIEVLDHGHVRLVECMGSDLSIVRNARVSYDAEWRTGEDAGKDEKLIHYLMQHGHTTPFEAVTFTFDVKAPIFVLRQWHRHRTWSYNELSARYRELPEEFYVPEPEMIGTQSTHNKQMRELREELSDTEEQWAVEICDSMRRHNEEAFKLYRELLEEGVPRELARTVLPTATYSHMFCSVDLHNLFHFLKLRLHSHAQHEIRVYAQAILRLITPLVPVAVHAFKEHHLVG